MLTWQMCVSAGHGIRQIFFHTAEVIEAERLVLGQRTARLTSSFLGEHAAHTMSDG
jgi:hypothetical protein